MDERARRERKLELARQAERDAWASRLSETRRALGALDLETSLPVALAPERGALEVVVACEVDDAPARERFTMRQHDPARYAATCDVLADAIARAFPAGGVVFSAAPVGPGGRAARAPARPAQALLSTTRLFLS